MVSASMSTSVTMSVFAFRVTRKPVSRWARWIAPARRTASMAVARNEARLCDIDEDLAVSARARRTERGADLRERILRRQHRPRIDAAARDEPQHAGIRAMTGVALGEDQRRARHLERLRKDRHMRCVASNHENRPLQRDGALHQGQ